jgi:hypothetical protein
VGGVKPTLRAGLTAIVSECRSDSGITPKINQEPSFPYSENVQMSMASLLAFPLWAMHLSIMYLSPGSESLPFLKAELWGLAIIVLCHLKVRGKYIAVNS